MNRSVRATAVGIHRFRDAPQKARHLVALMVIVLPGVLTNFSHAEENTGEENPYALCGGTREACDPFSYLSNDYAIPARGDYFAPMRSSFSYYTSPWPGYPGAWGYRGLPGYPVTAAPWIPQGVWPVPAPFGGSQFRPGISIAPAGGFSAFVGHPGNGIFIGIGATPAFPVGVLPLPGPNFQHGFNIGQPVFRPGLRPPPASRGLGAMQFPPTQAPVIRHP